MSVDIVLSTDRLVLPGLAVTVRSALENTTSQLNIHVISVGLRESDQEKLRQSWDHPYCGTVEFVDIGKKYLRHLQSFRSTAYLKSKATYARYFISDIFPHLDRCIYLDVDLLVLRDLTEAFEMDLGGNIAAAVRDISIRFQDENPALKLRLGLRDEMNYFNGGFMVMELNAWHRERLANELVKLSIERADDFHSQDQDALNVVLEDRTRLMDVSWNTMQYEKPMPLAGNVVHLIGTVKPWHIRYKAKFCEAYYEDVIFKTFISVLGRTEFRDWDPWNVWGLGALKEWVFQQMPTRDMVIGKVRRLVTKFLGLSTANRPLIVCCSPDYGDGWRELGPSLTGDSAQWVYFDDRPTCLLERATWPFNFAIVRACLSAVLRASSKRARLLVTQEPRTTFLCALFCCILRVKIDHYVFSFNFPELPKGLRVRLMRYAFAQVNHFTVHSSMERDLYSDYFHIPKERVRLRLWSIGVPKVSPDFPLQAGRYVSAIGGNGRDYRTLIEAARRLPEIPFALVVRPDNLIGLDIPANVKPMVNIPFGEAMNILLHSEFTVLPLAGSTVPCGHVTLVCAMHLAKAVVATDSKGISDYVRSGHNGILCKPLSPEDLAHAIVKLWKDPEEIDRLGKNNSRFGAENCSEAKVRSDLAEVLTYRDIPLQGRSSAATHRGIKEALSADSAVARL
jgi:lipopolysaccharide biosynthesis glycosyltransferase